MAVDPGGDSRLAHDGSNRHGRQVQSAAGLDVTGGAGTGDGGGCHVPCVKVSVVCDAKALRKMRAIVESCL